MSNEVSGFGKFEADLDKYELYIQKDERGQKSIKVVSNGLLTRLDKFFHPEHYHLPTIAMLFKKGITQNELKDAEIAKALKAKVSKYNATHSESQIKIEECFDHALITSSLELTRMSKKPPEGRFAKNPENYVLCVSTSRSGKKYITIRENDVSTWIDAHIFSRSAYKILSIVNAINTYGPAIILPELHNDQFVGRLQSKIEEYNKTHWKPIGIREAALGQIKKWAAPE